MPEIKPMNLTGVAHNPLSSLPRQESISEKARKSSQLALNKAMGKFQIKKLQRQENDYYMGKRAENFMFSNYPSSKTKGTFAEQIGGMKFGEGSRSEHLKRWKESVGGNLQQFEQWYTASRGAEMKGLQRSLVRDPLIHLTEESHVDYVTKTIAGLSPEDRAQFMGSLDGETLGVVNSIYQPGRETSTMDVLQQHIKDDPYGWGIGITGGLAAAAYGYRAFRRGKMPKGIDLDSLLKGKIPYEDAPKLLKSAYLDGSKLSRKQIQEMMNSNVISGADAKILWNGGRVIPKSVRGQGQINVGTSGASSSVASVADDVLDPKLLNSVNKDLTKYVKDGVMSQADSDKLKGVIQTMAKNGEKITPNSVGAILNKGGKKYESLLNTLKKDSIKGIGGLKKVGLLKGLGLGAGAYYGGSILGEGFAGALGAEEKNAELYGEATGTVTATGMAMGMPFIPKLQSLVKKRGMGWVIQQVGKKAGWQLAARLAAKSASGPLGWAMLGLDAYLLYDILSDLE
mgnify:CR=1 FL=1